MIFMIDALGLCPLKLNVPSMVTFRQAAINSQYGRSSGDIPAPRISTRCARYAGRRRTRHNHRPTIGRSAGSLMHA